MLKIVSYNKLKVAIMISTGKLFRISEMSREDAIKYIEENPDEIYDLIVLVSNNITEGWMARYMRYVK